MRAKGTVNRYVGYRIQKLRRQRALTSLEVARRAGLSPGSYSCLENGWYRINLDNLFRIIQVLDVQVSEVWPLVSESETPAQPLHDKDQEALMSELVKREPRSISPQDILEAVGHAFEVSTGSILNGSGDSRVQAPRAACALLSQEHPELTMSAVARCFGCSLSSLSRLVRRHREFQGGSRFAQRLLQARKFLRGHVSSSDTARSSASTR